MQKSLVGFFCLVLMSACGSNNASLPAGVEGGPCLPGNVCGTGLTCLSSLCVNAGRTDSGLDGNVITQDARTDTNVVIDTALPPNDQGTPMDSTVAADSTTQNDAARQPCDVFTQTCGAGNGCHYYEGSTTCFPTLTNDGAAAGTQGTACRNINECAAGYTCLTWNGQSGYCQQYCETGSQTRTCATGTCTHPSSWTAFPVLGVCRTS